MWKIKTIGTYKGANEDELTRGRKLIEKNKHLNLHKKKTKQKDEKNYNCQEAHAKEKRIINKKVQLDLTNCVLK